MGQFIDVSATADRPVIAVAETYFTDQDQTSFVVSCFYLIGPEEYRLFKRSYVALIINFPGSRIII